MIGIFPLLGAKNPNVEFMAGRFVVSGSANATVEAGKGFTAAQSSGVITITLTDPGATVLGAVGSLYKVTDSSAGYQLVLTSVSTSTVVFTAMSYDDAANPTAANLPNATGVSFVIVRQHSGLPST